MRSAISSADLSVHVDRRTAHYSDAITLAHHILRNVGRSLEPGTASAWTFLIRTPEMVEEGLRIVLQRLVEDRWRIEKKGRQIAGANMTLNPDLVFQDGMATGDVKYKQADPDWTRMRRDLYQAIAFATIYRTQHAMMVRFRTDDRPAAREVRVGPLSVTPFEWDARPEVAPQEAAIALAAEVELWLANMSVPP
jgi:5-methylcytosine-specific restriction enzyme subunit McrC